MLRSFDYAAETAARDIEKRQVEEGGRVRAAALVWRDLVVETFLEHYDQAVAGSPIEIVDKAARARLLDLYLAQKAIYEIGYEAANRPAWIGIPIGGLLAILNRTAEAR